MRERKTNFQVVHSCSHTCTKPENLTKIGQVGVEIIGLTKSSKMAKYIAKAEHKLVCALDDTTDLITFRAGAVGTRSSGVHSRHLWSSVGSRLVRCRSCRRRPRTAPRRPATLAAADSACSRRRSPHRTRFARPCSPFRPQQAVTCVRVASATKLARYSLTSVAAAPRPLSHDVGKARS